MDIIDKWIRFYGYGNFETANVVFLGNEEGLGGGENPELFERIRAYKIHQQKWLITIENWEWIVQKSCIVCLTGKQRILKWLFLS